MWACLLRTLTPAGQTALFRSRELMAHAVYWGHGQVWVFALRFRIAHLIGILGLHTPLQLRVYVFACAVKSSFSQPPAPAP